MVDIGFLFNTLIYEQFSNYLKVLLYYNSFRFREKKRLCKGSSEYKQNQFFIDNLSIIFSKYKNMIIKPIMIEKTQMIQPKKNIAKLKIRKLIIIRAQIMKGQALALIPQKLQVILLMKEQ